MHIHRDLCRASVGFVAMVLAVFEIPASAEQAHADDVFLRGDVNTDGVTSLADSLMLRNFLFAGDWPPPCMDAADFDDFGSVNISDQIAITSFLLAECPPVAFGPECRAPLPYPLPGTDPTESDGMTCDEYRINPPEETADLIRLGAVEAHPGRVVEIPVFVSNSMRVDGFQLVVRYDPVMFTPHKGSFTGTADSVLSFQGTFYEGLESRERSEIALASSYDGDLPHEGYFALIFIPDVASGDRALPPGSDTLAFKIRGTLSADARPGTAVLIEPANGPGGRGLGHAGLYNELARRNENRVVSERPRLAGALLQIVSDQTFFRGDSNQDQDVNLSDPVHVLVVLFANGGSIHCEDAADSNDDGRINLADATFLLRFLFQRGAPPPPPYLERGLDPTDDQLECLAGDFSR